MKYLRISKTIFLIIVLLNFCIRAQSVISDEHKKESPIINAHGNPRLKTPITLRSKDASISEVLKVLSERSGMNFVSGEGVNREKMTIMLNKTPLDEAINILVRASGLSYEIIGNSVLIAEPDKLKEEVGQMGYVVELKYTNAKEAAEILKDLTDKVKIDEGGNKLICFTSPRVINEIERVVRAIDHPHILIMLKTRLIEVTGSSLNEYGIDWEALSHITSQITYDGNRLLDGIQPDKWNLGDVQFNAILDLLVSNGDAKMLMDSKLTTTNNRTASLHIGDIVPYTVQSYNLSAAGGANYQIQKEEIGVKLTVTPHVNENSQVTLTIEPEVSSIIDWKGPSSDIPHIRTRKTKTTVRVENDQTVFIAGLFREDKTTSVKRVPLLGHIPILGYLFQHRKEETEKTNLIIEITPRIIFDSKDTSISTKASKEFLGKDAEEVLKNLGKKKRRKRRNTTSQLQQSTPEEKQEENQQ